MMARQKVEKEEHILVRLTPQEQRLLWYFHHLNRKGKHVIFDFMRALVATVTYTPFDTSEEIKQVQAELDALMQYRFDISTEPTGADMPKEDWDFDDDGQY